MNRNKILTYIKDNNLIEPGDNLLVAVSGGSDSMGLFSFLLQEKEYLQINKISACHINHGLRNQADSDQTLVEQYCKEKGISCYVKKVDVNRVAKEQKLSVETAARQVRYCFFEEKAKELQAKIVTAHNANDNLETALFHFTRGVSLKGICGIQNKRDNIIRPLLQVSKREIDLYCETNNIPVAVDLSNFDTLYTRNKLRHRVVPILEEINPNLPEGFSKRVETLKQEENFLEEETQKVYDLAVTHAQGFKLNLTKLEGIHPAIYNRVLVKFLEAIGKAPTHGEIQKIKDKLSDKKDRNLLQLRGNNSLTVQKGQVFVQEVTEVEAFPSYQIPIKHGEIYQYGGVFIKVFIYDLEMFEKKNKFNKNLLKNAVDYDTLKKGAFLRNKQDGDRFFLSERKVSKSLKKLFVEDKINASLRGRIPVLDNQGEPVWVYGYGSTPQVAVSETTKRVAVFDCRGILE